MYSRSALYGTYAGLVLTVVAMVAVAAGGGALADRVHHVYDAWLGEAEAGATVTVLRMYLYTVGVLGLLGWSATAWAVAKQARWFRVIGTVLFLVGLSIALLNLFLTEYGERVFPARLGVVGLLPAVAGAAVVVLLWRRPRG